MQFCSGSGYPYHSHIPRAGFERESLVRRPPVNSSSALRQKSAWLRNRSLRVVLYISNEVSYIHTRYIRPSESLSGFPASPECSADRKPYPKHYSFLHSLLPIRVQPELSCFANSLRPFAVPQPLSASDSSRSRCVFPGNAPDPSQRRVRCPYNEYRPQHE